MKNIQEIIDRHQENPDNEIIEEEQEVLRAYAQFLYEEPLEGYQPDEESVAQQEIYEEAVDTFEEELKLVVQSRRSRSLSYAITTFNKIQNKDLPLWMRPEGELNAQAVPEAELYYEGSTSDEEIKERTSIDQEKEEEESQVDDDSENDEYQEA